MNLPIPSFLTLFAATAPILIVLYLMIGRRWNGSQAGLAGWGTAVFSALFIFGGTPLLLLVSFGRALLLSFFVLYIIWAALLLYHILNEAGVIRQIGEKLPLLAEDKPAQIILLAWIFGSFLQGASGFGVPAAVVAPLLVGLGFSPNKAVIVALIGHAWAVTFGSLGSSFFSLIAATGADGAILAGPTAAFLALCCFACGLSCLFIATGFQGVRARFISWLLLGTTMSLTQYLLAINGFWSIASFGASLVGLVLFLILLQSKRKKERSVTFRSIAPPFFPYLLLTLVILAGETIFNQQLSFLILNWDFPQVQTSFGWIIPAGAGRSINLFGHAGALLLYASALTFLWYKWRGHFTPENSFDGRIIWQKTVRGSIKSTISIVAMISMAVTMQHAGMTQLLAETISVQAGVIFPLISPFIGVLGAFMTGSNTNSNVVFGLLQQETAVALHLSVPLILAGQTAGGAMGSLFAPAKVIVGCSTVEGAEEGVVLKQATIYGLGITTLVALLLFFMTLK